MKRMMAFCLGVLSMTIVLMVMATAPTIAATVDSGTDIPVIEMWQLVIAALLPSVIQFIKKQQWTSAQSRLAMIVTAALVAIGGSYFRGELDDFAFTSASVLSLIFLTHLSYETIWKSAPLLPVTEMLGSVWSGPSPENPRE